MFSARISCIVNVQPSHNFRVTYSSPFALKVQAVAYLFYDVTSWEGFEAKWQKFFNAPGKEKRCRIFFFVKCDKKQVLYCRVKRNS